MEILFAVVGVITAWLVVNSTNPIHSVLSLVLTFASLSILLLILGLEFLPLLFIIIYVGAIAILFLFVIMMLNIKIVEIVDNVTRYIPLGLFVGLIFLWKISSIFIIDQNSYVDFYNIKIKYSVLNENLFNFYQVKEINDIENIANLLYTDFYLYFMVGALLLLLAMIGAIILTIFHEKNLKRQDLFVQITTKYSETVKNINVK